MHEMLEQIVDLDGNVFWQPSIKTVQLMETCDFEKPI